MKYKKRTALILAGAMAASLMFAGCGEDNALITAGDQVFTLGYVSFVAHYTQAAYDSMLSYYYGDDYWTDESLADEDGLTMEESVKNDVLDDVEESYVLDQHRADYDIEVTDEEQAAMQDAAALFMEQNSRQAIRALDASEEYVAQMLYYDTVSTRMKEAIRAEVGNDLDIADYKQRTFSYIQIDSIGYSDENGYYIAYTDEEAEDVQTEAALIAELAIGDFDGAAEEYGYSVLTYSYGDDEAAEEDGGFSEAVIAEADRLSEGEVSGVIDTGDYLYIIRLDSEDDQDAAETAMTAASNTMKNDYYDEVVDGYLAEVDFTVDEEQWAKVRFSDEFTFESLDEDEAE